MKEPQKTLATVDALALHKCLDAEFLRQRFDLCDDARGVVIPHRAVDGTPARSRLRKYVETAHPTRWHGDGAMRPYIDDETLEKARTYGALVVCEGETDRWTLERHGIPAVGVPGAKMIRLLTKKHVEGIPHILVVREPDEAGQCFACDVPAHLRALGYDDEISLVDIHATCGAKDPSELHVRDPERFVSEWQRVVEMAVPTVPASTGGNDNSPLQSGGRRAQSDLLVELADALGVDFVHDEAMVPYALVRLDDVRVVYSIESTAFKSLLAKEFFERYDKAPRATALSDAARVFQGRAQHAGQLAEVALRVAGGDDVIDLDLGDDEWSMARVTPDGWSVVPHGDRLFRRAPGLLALPNPIHGGNLAELRRFVRVSDDDFPLILAFLASAIRPRGPYPVLLLTGEQGSAKTTTARILRRIIDPNKADVRAEPRDNRDLAIAANNGHVVALDNLSHVTAQLSNALCRLSTGGGFTTRTLYTNDEETIFDQQRPTIITSIADVGRRPDLLERAIQVRLEPIPESERRTESELWSEFSIAHPYFLGALLDAASAGLRNVREVDRNTKRKPRMADAFCWTLAAAPAMGLEVAALREAWGRTQEEAQASVLESSAIAPVLLRLIVDTHGAWDGTATDLLTQLAALAGDAMTRRRDWPKSPTALADQVRNIAPALRANGIDHDEGRTAKRRLHKFTAVKAGASDASLASPLSLGSSRHGEYVDDSASFEPHSRHHVEMSVTRSGRLAAADDAGDGDDDGFLDLSSPALETDPC